jgi:ATPase family AAA domain-containing protein 2
LAYLNVLLELVPSSARSSTSAAAQLPSQFVPLLSDALEQVKNVIAKVLPVGKKRSALEEAEYEDDDEDGALEREMMLQCEFLLFLCRRLDI